MVSYGNISDYACEGMRCRVSLGQHPATVICERENSMTRRAGNAEAAFDAAQNPHTSVQPAIGIEIPGRDQ
jgi:hypothetical protein